MPPWTFIAITQSWPLPKARDAWIDDSPPPIDHPPEHLVRAKAWSDARRDRNLMSEKLAGELLGNENQVNHIGIRYYHVVDQTVGMRRLQIVHGLEYDVVFSGNSYTDSAPEPSLQRWTSLTMLSDNGSSRGSVNPGADSLSSIEDCENESPVRICSAPPSSVEELPCGYSYQPSDLLSVAGSHGFLVMDPSSLEAFASLLHMSHQGSIDDNLLGFNESPALDNWTLNSNLGSKTDSYRQSSTTTLNNSDPDHLLEWDQESWSTYPSKEALCPLPPRERGPYKPAEPGRRISMSEETRSEIESETSMASSWSDSFSSTSSGAQVQTVSENLCGGIEDSFKREKDDIQALSNSLFEQNPSISEFEDHPGHEYWEWSVTRQRWHRKGGTADADWFPEYFA